MSDQKFGSVEFSGDDVAYPSLAFDRIAVDNRNELLMISLVGPTQILKGVRAILNTNKRCNLKGGGVLVRQPADRCTAYGGKPIGYMIRGSDGYRMESHRLPFGLAHAVFLARSPGFLPSMAEEHVWQEVMSERFTTPLLRSWMPWVIEEMKSTEMLVGAHCHGCNCGYIVGSSPDLDAIVTRGLQSGAIAITSGTPALELEKVA